MKPYNFITNQSTSPVELLARLSHIKSAKEMSSVKLKQIKKLQDNLSFYERYCLSTLQNLQQKISTLTAQFDGLKNSYRNVQQLGVEKFDKVQKMLEQTLTNYEIDRKKGQMMIKEMVQMVQDKLEKSILQKSMKSSQLVQEFLHLNTRIQSIVQSLNSMENQLMSQYEKLRIQLNNKFKTLSDSINQEINETHEHTEILLRKLQQIQKDCDSLIENINEKKQNKRYQMHQMLEKMIEQTIESNQN